MRNRRMQLLQFGFQLLVDKHQRLQRAADVAIAGGDDFVDRGIVGLRSRHAPNPPMDPVTLNCDGVLDRRACADGKCG